MIGAVISFGCTLVGLFAGFLFALIGMGPGMIIVSSLHLMCGYDLKKAATGSLFLLIPVSISSVTAHFYYSNTFSPSIPWILCGSLIGVDLGLFLRRKLSPRTLRILFTIFLTLVIFRHFSNLLEISIPLATFDFNFDWYHHMITGCLASTLSASMGIGGGVLIMTTYFGVLGFPVKEVAVTSACVVSLNTSLSSFKSRKILYWDSNLSLILSFGLVGAFLGGLTSSRVSEEALRWLVGGFLVVVLLNMVRGLLKDQKVRE